MAGFIRGTQPAQLNRASLARFVADCVAQELLPDPFAVAHDCVNPAGHDVQPSCGALACVHCSKVFWQ